MRFGVGLWCLQSTWSTPRGHVRAYREYLEDARLADELGYDSLWLSEHHFYYDGYCPALLTAAAAGLAVTKRLRLGTGMLLAPYQRPARVAAAAREIGRRFGGRLDVGLGMGYRDVEFDGKGVPRRERVHRLTELVGELEHGAGDETYTVCIGAQAAPGVARAGRLGRGILLSGALPLEMVRALTSAHDTAWIEGGRPGGTKPRVAALRNLWITSDDAERAAVLDWQRASYVLYQGLGWTVAESDAGAAMDFAGDAERAIETAVATTIIGSVDEVIDGLRQVADAGVDDVVLRIAVEGAPQEAIHTGDARVRRRRVPGPRRFEVGAVRLGVTLPPGGEAELAAAAESVGVPFVHVAASPGTESAIAATVVVATTTVRVIVGVNVGDEHPVTLAEEIAVLDNLSNGRIGVIAELGALGADDATEDVSVLRASWSGRAIAHRGRRWQVPAGLPGHVAPAAVMVTPPPAQLEIPLWVAGEYANSVGQSLSLPVVAGRLADVDRIAPGRPRHVERWVAASRLIARQ